MDGAWVKACLVVEGFTSATHMSQGLSLAKPCHRWSDQTQGMAITAFSNYLPWPKPLHKLQPEHRIV